ncbi:MAG: hypothetical protein RL563_1181 [Pseudomonadota bacterium]
MNEKPVFDYPLFKMGFRVFFALAGLSALALLALWNSLSNGSLHLGHYFSGNAWHAHEMLFGYTAAVIAGFLLTAVKNWTGEITTTPDQLAGLSLLWLYGRVLPFYAELLPDALIAAVDVAFLPSLAYFLVRPILKAQQFTNLLFVGLLLVMAIANGLIHAQELGFSASSAGLGMNLVLAIIVLMILVIAGRVFPFFTERGLSGVVCIRNPMLDVVACGLSLSVFVLMMSDISGILLTLVALAAAVANLLRVSAWYDARIWYVPLLWVLYVGYGWLILGFVLVALSAFQWVIPVLALHAFTLGGIGVLTLGMMARVTLGHTGRVLRASNIMALAFLMLNLAGLIRVILPAVLPDWYSGFVWAASYGWLAAFSLFVYHYLPMLLATRVDGQQG